MVADDGKQLITFRMFPVNIFRDGPAMYTLIFKALLLISASFGNATANGGW